MRPSRLLLRMVLLQNFNKYKLKVTQGRRKKVIPLFILGATLWHRVRGFSAISCTVTAQGCTVADDRTLLVANPFAESSSIPFEKL
jgi:hypothetical protein